MSTARARECVLLQLDHHREHVLRSVEGLSERDLDRPVAPSGWTCRTMVSHLRYDSEIFWIQAVLGGCGAAIDQIRDGWSAPPLPGPILRGAYRRDITRSNEIIEQVDLDALPAWHPPADVFSGPLLSTGWHVVLRVLSETSVHAGHLDMAREAIDGHQELAIT